MALMGSVLASYGLFCLLLKWSPFHNRLLLPLVILGVPVMAFGVSQGLKPKLQRWLMILLLIMALAYSLTSLRRPVLPLPILSEPQRLEQSPSILSLDRQAMYFSGARKELATPYQEAATTILQRQCQRVGLAFGGGDPWEYPLWVLLTQPSAMPNPVWLKHVGVTNGSANLPDSFPDDDLCAVIALHTVDSPLSWSPPKDWPIWYETLILPQDESMLPTQLTVFGHA
jgi:hypothetical protein